MGLLRQPTIARLTNYLYIYIYIYLFYSFSQASSMMFHDSATISIQEDENQGAVGQLNPHGKKSPALTTADQGDLMHEGSSTRFTRFSVFDFGICWDQNLGGCVIQKTKMFGWFGGFQHQGTPIQIPKYKWWNFEEWYFGMLGTFFLLSAKMACRWQMSSIDWYQRYCEPLIIMLFCHICQSRISTCHEDVTRFVVVLQETSQGCKSLQHVFSGHKVFLRHFMFWCSRCPCIIRKLHTWFKSMKFTLPESGLHKLPTASFDLYVGSF